jgi:WD40 repeat protein
MLARKIPNAKLRRWILSAGSSRRVDEGRGRAAPDVGPATGSEAPRGRAVAGKRARERYQAFLSYSHAADGQFAPALQRGLHRLAKPWYRPPALRVFRDQTSLTATPGLWSSIERAMEQSEFFVLLASPAAAKSPWVDREVAWWRSHKPRDRLLIALTDGDLRWDHDVGAFDTTATDALPPSIHGAFTEEPKWVDFRFARTSEDVSLGHPAFRDRVADIAAPLHGVTKEELVGEDVRQQRRTIRWRNATISVLVLLTLLAALATVIALDQRSTALAQRDVADSQRLAAQATALVARQPDLALLLNLEGLRIVNTDEAWAGLQGLLSSPVHASWELVGHSDTVIATAVDDAGSTVATASSDGTVRLWRAADGQPIGEPLGHGDDLLYDVALSPDGTLVASAGSDGITRVWPVDTTVDTFEDLTHGGSVNAVAFSPATPTIATAGSDGYVRLWRVGEGTFLSEVLASPPGVTDVTFSPDGATLATAGFNGNVRFWDAETLTPVGEPLTEHRGIVQALAFSPDGALLASGGDDGTARLWDTRTLLPAGEPIVHNTAVRGVAFSPDGGTLATASGMVAYMWEVVSGEPVSVPFAGHTDWVSSVVFAGRGTQLVTSSGDRTARVWDVAETQPIDRPSLATSNQDLAFSPDGAQLATASQRGVVVWDVATGESVVEPIPHSGPANAVAFSPDGGELASADQTIRRWRLDGTAIGEPIEHFLDAYDLEYSPDGGLLASAGFDGVIRLWHAHTGEPVRRFSEGDSGVSDIDFSPNGAFLASAGLDGVTRIWDTSTGQLVGRFAAQDEAVTAVAYSPDGILVAAATNEGLIRLWDVDSGAAVSVLRGHTRWVNTVAFSPDGTLLASGSDDATARLWDVTDGRLVGSPLTGHADSVTSVVFSPDGRLLATGSVDNTVHLSITPSRWLSTACDLARRNLSAAEWRDYLGEAAYVRTCPRYPPGPSAPTTTAQA